MTDYIFILFSCKKNAEIANKTYEKIYNKLANSKVYIIYGDETQSELYKILDDKYIILNVLDDYDHLNDKVLALIKTIHILHPSAKGMFKCDDDICVNLKHINLFLTINHKLNIDYCGKKIIRTKEYNDGAMCKLLDKHPTVACIYCGGPFYYLSKKALECFNDTKHFENIYYEDMMVGYHLNKYNIYPSDNINLYTDNIMESNTVSYHNGRHHNELYTVITGGLGNQLFQIACAMKLAKKYDKQFVLNTKLIMKNTHQPDTSTTLSTIQKLFPALPICDKNVSRQDYIIFQEGEFDGFTYTERKLDDLFNVYNNVALKGYFINYNYIPKKEENTLFNHVAIKPDTKSLLNMDFTDTYFIHIRLGDFLKQKMYQINLKPYYTYCIHEIIRLNKNAKFIICTNQYDNALYDYINNFPKTVTYSIQEKSNNDIDTLYIMSSCCGGICSNSTLSYMGAFFQKNRSKENVYMPYPFVDFVYEYNETNVTLDMYPEWCNVYSTIEKIITK